MGEQRNIAIMALLCLFDLDGQMCGVMESSVTAMMLSNRNAARLE